MAKVIDELPGRGWCERKYRWDAWLDGRIWRLERGIDFAVSVVNFRNYAWRYAHRRGVRLVTRCQGDTVYLHAVKQ